MSNIIDGKKKAEQVRADIAREVAALLAAGKPRPGLAVVLVGEDPASQVYVRNKVRQSEEVGFHSIEHRLPADASQQQVLELVQHLNRDPAVNGILVQLPLPKHIDQAPIIEAIHPAKDVDGLTTVNAGLLTNGQQGLVPCTPLGCILLLRDVVPSFAGLNAVVLGRSILVGKPVASLLLAENCTVTIAHSRTRELAEVCRAADILVAAVGRPKMVQGDWVKPGAIVIDVGINRVQDGDKSRLVGDVDFEAAAKVAGAITPVPGGVGPMTIACLLANTLTAAKRQFGGN
ncbi:MAG: bifunctional methylenetetrahydrofolate dehydrogenase/methenyltetrahydrofolate cyclohydrolase FolD [Gammaproteobacteria bacterium]|nr:bifunctional methylenetetrahydrofolate dehydrogenase/methenyltetrahydrofolate cyclohydrolase FolD [Gammaproteobacteria bacterium]